MLPRGEWRPEARDGSQGARGSLGLPRCLHQARGAGKTGRGGAAGVSGESEVHCDWGVEREGEARATTGRAQSHAPRFGLLRPGAPRGLSREPRVTCACKTPGRPWAPGSGSCAAAERRAGGGPGGLRPHRRQEHVSVTHCTGRRPKCGRQGHNASRRKYKTQKLCHKKTEIQPHRGF